MIQIYFIITGIGCLLYYGIIRHYTGKWNSTFAGFWLFAGLIHLGGFLLWDILPKWLQILGVIGLAMFWIMFGVTETCICRGMRQKPAKDADYLIVLGAHVNGRKITHSLMKRLDAAYRYLCENPQTKVIVSGGQGEGEDIAEADAMADNLLERGIGEKRIIREDKSTTTAENLRFSQQKIFETYAVDRISENGCKCKTNPKTANDELPELTERDILQSASVAVVTNNFHIYRALLIGRQMGYRRLSGLSAKSTRVLQVNYLVREFFAIILTKVRAML